jgi:hypothetical protein
MDCPLYNLEACNVTLARVIVDVGALMCATALIVVLARLRSTYVCQKFAGTKVICPLPGYCATSIANYRNGLDFNGAAWVE